MGQLLVGQPGVKGTGVSLHPTPSSRVSVWGPWNTLCGDCVEEAPEGKHGWNTGGCNPCAAVVHGGGLPRFTCTALLVCLLAYTHRCMVDVVR
jgi:hypothetical protein